MARARRWLQSRVSEFGGASPARAGQPWPLMGSPGRRRLNAPRLLGILRSLGGFLLRPSELDKIRSAHDSVRITDWSPQLVQLRVQPTGCTAVVQAVIVRGNHMYYMCCTLVIHVISGVLHQFIFNTFDQPMYYMGWSCNTWVTNTCITCVWHVLHELVMRYKGLNADHEPVYYMGSHVWHGADSCIAKRSVTSEVTVPSK